MAKDPTASSGKRCWLPVDADTSLLALDGSATPGFPGEEASAREQTEVLRTELVELQARLYAESRQRLLVVLQAMDTGGKDGVIRKVFSGVNPLGVKVARFERPTEAELSRDYLWRVHPHVPANGEIVIFNRSHYEDVLVVRVNALVPKARWKLRYDHIREFERMLADEGTTIVKFYLHIDRDEQARRLQARLDDPQRQWKFDPHDLEQRKHWNAYMLAFRDAIVQTDRKCAPWYTIPANRKWYRDWAVMNILVRTLRDMNPRFPAPTIDPATITIT
ncbi:MAG: polyphosphate kinase 2 family protein [Burkholderiaceae bacterium]|nr:polyphosphate kinase 2 family protein [Burkholderiaceae bacterium]